MPTQITDPELEDVEEQDSTVEEVEVAEQEEDATLEQGSVDVETLAKEYEQKLAQSQADLNALKSSLQKREHQIVSESQKKYNELQDQFRQFRLSQMDDGERAKYESQFQQERLETLQAQIVEAQRRADATDALMNAYTFFIGQGVPAKNLVVNDGYDALTASGWTYLQAEREELRKQLTDPKLTSPKKPVKPLKKAPVVLTDKSTPGGGNTWESLTKRFGSLDRMFTLIEQGQLSADILPKEG